METSARLDKVEEALKRLQDNSEKQDANLKELKELMMAMANKTVESQSTQPGLAESSTVNRGAIAPAPHGMTNGQAAVQTRYTRLDFPRFAGDNPKGWIYRCERFFDFNGTGEIHKVHIASIHLEDKALEWFQGYLSTHGIPTWLEFSHDICLRFGPNVYEDDTGVLTKLKQDGLVRNYHERFEELANRTKGLPEEFFVSCFISGLKEEIRPIVQMFRPKTMIQVVGLARLQEEHIEAIGKHHGRAPIKPHVTNPQPTLLRDKEKLPPVRRIN